MVCEIILGRLFWFQFQFEGRQTMSGKEESIFCGGPFIAFPSNRGQEVLGEKKPPLVEDTIIDIPPRSWKVLSFYGGPFIAFPEK